MWRIGQRVVSELEPELGLGLVIEVVGARLVEVSFPGVEVKRHYASQTAPLRRIIFATGQQIRSRSGMTFVIARFTENAGIVSYYSATGEVIPEPEIDPLVENDNPLAHLFEGNWGPRRAYELRRQAWKLRGLSLDPELRGLVGGRVALLPHQLDICSRVAHREFPRVLLADEVGLGKTIEAGLIFSSMRALGRADRVLVLVPDGLEHQWLAEMYRRFGEMFSLVDEERSEAEDASQGQSAFQMNQRIICSLSFLQASTERLQQILEVEWDLLIVDEAHRLHWTEAEPSVPWEIARLLAARSRGLLLLTATPERQGLETEFGLLHLVDPERFRSFESFQSESTSMRQTAEMAAKVQAGDRSPPFLSALKKRFREDAGINAAITLYEKGEAGTALLEQFIDRHGTGRVFIRNRRSRLKGFPERRLKKMPLPVPPAWEEALAGLNAADLSDDDIFLCAAGIDQLAIGNGPRDWFAARARGVLQLLQSLGEQKVLLICSSVERVERLQAWLRTESTVRTAIFHEEMEIVERDRQAAWFADPNGARVLLCSEIGGEGRNFQFCQHLLLFDLPLHPDALEQRIGRLDRIGQKAEIEIHVPYFTDTAEEALVLWYAEGMEGFSLPWNGGDLGSELRTQMLSTFRSFFPADPQFPNRQKGLARLLKATSQAAKKIRTEQAASIDILIDLNSFNESRGRTLAQAIALRDQDGEIAQFMNSALDYFGLDTERLDSKGTLKLTLHSLSLVDSFPGFGSESELLGTYRREHALIREELEFFSIEHPVVHGAIALLLEENKGRITAARRAEPSAQPLLLEFLFVLQPTAPASLEVERDFPLRTLNFGLTIDGQLVEALSDPYLSSPAPLSHQRCRELIATYKDALKERLQEATVRAQELAAPLVAEAIEKRRARYQTELTRLQALAKVNPLITAQEIEAHRQMAQAGLDAIQALVPRLDAISILE